MTHYNIPVIVDMLIDNEVDVKDEAELLKWFGVWDVWPPISLVTAEWCQRKLDEAEIGDGVALLGYSDVNPATVVKRTAKTMTVQHDKAKRLHDPKDLKPVIGGFACHFAEQHNQRWEIERDPEGLTQKLRRTKAGWRTKGAAKNDVEFGRRKFYDYNF